MAKQTVYTFSREAMQSIAREVRRQRGEINANREAIAWNEHDGAGREDCVLGVVTTQATAASGTTLGKGKFKVRRLNTDGTTTSTDREEDFYNPATDVIPVNANRVAVFHRHFATGYWVIIVYPYCL